MMSEAGNREFSPRPTDAETEQDTINARYTEFVPENVRGLFAGAGIENGVKAILGKSMHVQLTDEKELSLQDKMYFDVALGKLYTQIKESDFAEKEQAQDALTKFVSSTEIEGVGSLEHALGYDDFGEPIDLDADTEGEQDPTQSFERECQRILESIGVEKDDERFERFVDDLKTLKDKSELTPEGIDALQKRWTAMGIRKSEAAALLEASILDDNQKKLILEEIPEKTEEEIAAEEKVGEGADEVSDQIRAQQQQAEQRAKDMPDGPEKENLLARLARANLRLEELYVKKTLRGIGKLAFIVALAVLVAIVWEMQMINKGSKKK